MINQLKERALEFALKTLKKSSDFVNSKTLIESATEIENYLRERPQSTESRQSRLKENRDVIVSNSKSTITIEFPDYFLHEGLWTSSYTTQDEEDA